MTCPSYVNNPVYRTNFSLIYLLRKIILFWNTGFQTWKKNQKIREVPISKLFPRRNIWTTKEINLLVIKFEPKLFEKRIFFQNCTILINYFQTSYVFRFMHGPLISSPNFSIRFNRRKKRGIGVRNFQTTLTYTIFHSSKI